MNDALKTRIEDIIKSKKVVLFMKGSSMMPMCGFSAQAIEALRRAGARELATFDVLKDPELRQGIKEFTSWPTIPQVFIDGKFVGGSDILVEMQEAGELAPLVA